MTLAGEREEQSYDDALRPRGRRRWVAPAAAVGALAVGAGLLGIVVPAVMDRGPQFTPLLHEDFSTDVPVGSFPGSDYSSTWSVYPDGWKDTSGVGTYAPDRVLSVQDGSLRIAVGSDGDEFLGAALVADDTYGQRFGRYTVRWRADPVSGYGLAFLLWPDSERWPEDGEVDFPEGALDGTIQANAHHADADGATDNFDTEVTMDEWHTSVLEWTPSGVVFTLDGEFVGRSTVDVPQNPMHWVMQIGTDGTGVPSKDARGVVQVDWVQLDSYRG